MSTQETPPNTPSPTAVENAPNKPVHLMYLCGAIIAFYLIQWSVDWIVGYFTKPPSEFVCSLIGAAGALVLAVALYKNNRVYTLACEIAAELKKVTWPSAKDVRVSTIVVMTMSVLSALILFGFDKAWQTVTNLIYGT